MYRRSLNHQILLADVDSNNEREKSMILATRDADRERIEIRDRDEMAVQCNKRYFKSIDNQRQATRAVGIAEMIVEQRKSIWQVIHLTNLRSDQPLRSRRFAASLSPLLSCHLNRLDGLLECFPCADLARASFQMVSYFGAVRDDHVASIVAYSDVVLR